MFSIDDSLKTLKATRDQVVALHVSINTHQVGIPGRRSGPAQAYVVGLRGQAGHSVYVYLHLASAGDSAVYVPEEQQLNAAQFGDAEQEALAFAESMGFMMDNLSFSSLSPADQDAMLKTAAPFQVPTKPAPPAASPPTPGPRASAAPSPPAASTRAPSPEPAGDPIALGRLFSSF